MVVTDPEIRLTDYLALAQTISENVDPVSDIHFLRGPIDILDHSSSRYAYGSKMGMDATRKLPQELDSISPPSPVRGGVGGEVLSPDVRVGAGGEVLFPEIKAIRSDLLLQGISMVIIAVKKTKKQQIRTIAAELLGKGHVINVKFILFIDDRVDLSSLPEIVWISANNIDPMRDCFYIELLPGIKIPTLCIDGTRKTRELDDFNRDWPNIIVMDDETITRIDHRWDSLRLGPFIASPSLQFKSLVINSGPVINC